MGYFRELPNILYQSPLLHKNSSTDYIGIKNLFRRAKLYDYLSENVSIFNKFVIGDGDRPDTIAESLYNDSSLDYVVVLVAGITNINHEWPLQDFQVYDYALQKYGTESKMFENHHYETFEIKDDKGRQILPPDLIVDKDFKMDGSALRFNSTYTLISEAGNTQLDDKNEYTVSTDNIARAVSNFEHEISENEKKREINVLRNGYLSIFINDLREVVRYDRSSGYISNNIAIKENKNIIP